MKYLIIALIVFAPAFCNCQMQKDEVIRIAQSNFALCIVNLESSDKHKNQGIASGFIVKGEYFVTCYHTFSYHSFPGYKVISAFVYCNIKEDGKGGFIRDSIELNLKDTINYHFDSANHLTDFAAVKLMRLITPHKILFNNDGIGFNDTLYSVGAGSNDNFILGLKKSTLSGMYSYNEIGGDTTFSLFTYLGDVKGGMSGSAIYNKWGHLVGMVQQGFDSIEQLNKAQPSLRKATFYQKIIEGYKNGLRVGGALSTKYILSHYLKL